MILKKIIGNHYFTAEINQGIDSIHTCRIFKIESISEMIDSDDLLKSMTEIDSIKFKLIMYYKKIIGEENAENKKA